MADTNLNTGTGPEQARTLERSANVKTQVVAFDVGGAAGPEKLVDSNNPVPVGDATLADLQNSILALNETMTYLLGAMLEKMPRLDSADRLVARMVVNGENDINSPYAGIAANSVGRPRPGARFVRAFGPWRRAGGAGAAGPRRPSPQPVQVDPVA